MLPLLCILKTCSCPLQATLLQSKLNQIFEITIRFVFVYCACFGLFGSSWGCHLFNNADSDSSSPQTPAEPIWNHLVGLWPEPKSIRAHLRDEVPRSLCLLEEATGDIGRPVSSGLGGVYLGGGRVGGGGRGGQEVDFSVVGAEKRHTLNANYTRDCFKASKRTKDLS